MQRRTELVLLIGAAVGMALWYAAPSIAGQPLPWNGGLRYLAALAIAGAVLEVVARGAVWPGPVGLYAGQALALLLQIITRSEREPWPIPFQLLFIASITLSALLGSVAVAAPLAWRNPLPQNAAGTSSIKASSKKTARP